MKHFQNPMAGFFFLPKTQIQAKNSFLRIPSSRDAFNVQTVAVFSSPLEREHTVGLPFGGRLNNEFLYLHE